MVFGSKSESLQTADVSVVIPLYNHERFIGQAIESVLQQTALPREIICIDDGSTDGSARRAEALARKVSCLRFWSRPNQGAQRTLNEGIRASAGRYVAILNSDDAFHPSRLATCLAAFEADPQVSVVASRISFIDEHGRSISNPWYDEAWAFYQSVGDLGLALVNGNFLMTTSNIVVRRSVFDEVGDFDDFRYAHDLDFFLRLAVQGKKLTIVPGTLLNYRIHTSNTISEFHKQVRIEWAVVVALFAWRLASRQDPSSPKSEYLARLLNITDRHQLTEAFALSLLHFLGSETLPKKSGACLVDANFRTALQGVIH